MPRSFFRLVAVAFALAACTRTPPVVQLDDTRGSSTDAGGGAKPSSSEPVASATATTTVDAAATLDAAATPSAVPFVPPASHKCAFRFEVPKECAEDSDCAIESVPFDCPCVDTLYVGINKAHVGRVTALANANPSCKRPCMCSANYQVAENCASPASEGSEVIIARCVKSSKTGPGTCLTSLKPSAKKEGVMFWPKLPQAATCPGRRP
jgi:hypothetical protein